MKRLSFIFLLGIHSVASQYGLISSQGSGFSNGGFGSSSLGSQGSGFSNGGFGLSSLGSQSQGSGFSNGGQIQTGLSSLGSLGSSYSNGGFGLSNLGSSTGYSGVLNSNYGNSFGSFQFGQSYNSPNIFGSYGSSSGGRQRGDQKDPMDRVAGRTVFQSRPYSGQNYLPQVHGLAVTISKISPQNSAIGRYSALYGGGFNHNNLVKGLSLNLIVQISRPGYYHVVLTSLAAVQRGCSTDTLGDPLQPDRMFRTSGNPWELFGYTDYGRGSDLPDGVVAELNLGRNIPRTVHISRLTGYTSLEHLAGRGVALCEATPDSKSRRLCRGAIPICTGLAYSGKDAELGFIELPSPTVNVLPDGSYRTVPFNLTAEEFYRRPIEPRVYYDMDLRPYIDDEKEQLDTYSPPPPPTFVTYDSSEFLVDKPSFIDTAPVYEPIPVDYSIYE